MVEKVINIFVTLAAHVEPIAFHGNIDEKDIDGIVVLAGISL